MTKTLFAGAGWVEAQLRYQHRDAQISEIGRIAADILGQAFQGVYHVPGVEKIDWSNEHHIEVSLNRSIATWDDNKLSTLVVLAHDSCVRLEVGADLVRYYMHPITGEVHELGEDEPVPTYEKCSRCARLRSDTSESQQCDEHSWMSHECPVEQQARLKLMFHKREGRTGNMMRRHPTIETAIRIARGGTEKWPMNQRILAQLRGIVRAVRMEG